jgi:hypothetical protein
MGLGAEHLAHGGGQGLGAVDDHQQPVIERQATVDQGSSGARTTLLFSVKWR